MLNSYNAQFTTLSNNTYDSKVARQCIDRIATHCAKLIPKHIQNNVGNHIKGDINFLFSYRIISHFLFYSRYFFEASLKVSLKVFLEFLGDFEKRP